MSFENPISSNDQDKANRGPFVNKISDLICDLKSEGPTIAIQGPYGEGKSSVANLINKKLMENGGFNTLMFQTSVKNNLIRDLVDEMLTILELDNSYRNWLTNNMDRIKAIFSVDKMTGAAAEIAESFIDYNKWLNEDVEKIIKALKERKESLVIFVDDLDRVDGRKLANFLLKSKEIFNHKNFIFVYLYDRNVIIETLSGINKNWGRTFLLKFFDYNYNLPKLSKTEQIKYLQLSIQKLCPELYEIFKFEQLDETDYEMLPSTPREIEKLGLRLKSMEKKIILNKLEMANLDYAWKYLLFLLMLEIESEEFLHIFYLKHVKNPEDYKMTKAFFMNDAKQDPFNIDDDFDKLNEHFNKEIKKICEEANAEQSEDYIKTILLRIRQDGLGIMTQMYLQKIYEIFHKPCPLTWSEFHSFYELFQVDKEKFNNQLKQVIEEKITQGFTEEEILGDLYNTALHCYKLKNEEAVESYDMIDMGRYIQEAQLIMDFLFHLSDLPLYKKFFHSAKNVITVFKSVTEFCNFRRDGLRRLRQLESRLILNLVQKVINTEELLEFVLNTQLNIDERSIRIRRRLIKKVILPDATTRIFNASNKPNWTNYLSQLYWCTRYLFSDPKISNSAQRTDEIKKLLRPNTNHIKAIYQNWYMLFWSLSKNCNSQDPPTLSQNEIQIIWDFLTRNPIQRRIQGSLNQMRRSFILMDSKNKQVLRRPNYWSVF